MSMFELDRLLLLFGPTDFWMVPVRMHKKIRKLLRVMSQIRMSQIRTCFKFKTWLRSRLLNSFKQLDSVELKDRSLPMSQSNQHQLRIESASHPLSLLLFIWRTGDLMKYTTGFIVGMPSMMTIRILACWITIASFLAVKFQTSLSWDSSQCVYVRSWVPVSPDHSAGVYVSGFFDYEKICRNRKTLIISVESHLGLTFAMC